MGQVVRVALGGGVDGVLLPLGQPLVAQGVGHGKDGLREPEGLLRPGVRVRLLVLPLSHHAVHELVGDGRLREGAVHAHRIVVVHDFHALVQALVLGNKRDHVLVSMGLSNRRGQALPLW